MSLTQITARAAGHLLVNNNVASRATGGGVKKHKMGWSADDVASVPRDIFWRWFEVDVVPCYREGRKFCPSPSGKSCTPEAFTFALWLAWMLSITPPKKEEWQQ